MTRAPQPGSGHVLGSHLCSMCPQRPLGSVPGGLLWGPASSLALHSHQDGCPFSSLPCKPSGWAGDSHQRPQCTSDISTEWVFLLVPLDLGFLSFAARRWQPTPPPPAPMPSVPVFGSSCPATWLPVASDSPIDEGSALVKLCSREKRENKHEQKSAVGLGSASGRRWLFFH